MWAMVIGDKITRVFREPQGFTLRTDFTVDRKVPVGLPKQRRFNTVVDDFTDDLQYPAEVFTKWSDQERADIGIYNMTSADNADPARYTVDGFRYETVKDGDGVIIRVDERPVLVELPEEQQARFAEGQRAFREREIKGKMEAALQDGMPYGKNVVQVDEASLNRMFRTVDALQRSRGGPVTWRMMDNSMVELSADALLEMYTQAVAFVDEHLRTSWAERDGLDAQDALATRRDQV